MAIKFPKNDDGTYVGLDNTNYPVSVDSWQDNLDVSSEMLAYANQYRSAMESNNLSLAQSILTQHPDLERMQIKAKDINEMKHGIMALERWTAENFEEYLGKYTQSAKEAATTAGSYASAASESASRSESSANNAYQSEKAAEQYKNDADLMVETLRTLTGTLPSDFTEYVNDMAGVKDYVDNEIAAHNKNLTAHEDIRKEVTQAQTDIRLLYLHHETGIATNTFSITFEDLDDVNVTGGTWDVANDRIWF